jgi:hypothetical protein
LDGLGTVAYQWKANGEIISGANADMFTLGLAQIGKALSVTASYTDGFGAFESITASLSETVNSSSQAPSISGIPTAKQRLTLGEGIGLANLAVSDPTSATAKLVLTLSANNGVFSIISNPGNLLPALQLSGTAGEINTTLKYLNFAALDAGSASIQAYLVNSAVNLPTWVTIPFDSVSTTAPGLPQSNGASAVAGDGNGDGIADMAQAAVASISVSKSASPSTSVNATSSYVTLVADSNAGKFAHPQSPQPLIHGFLQTDAPSKLPTVIAPLGRFTFTAITNSSEKVTPFSLYLDSDLGINGYWMQNASGYWTNLALPVNGGVTITEGGKLRLDFQIEDGGILDSDGLANGIIVNTGIAGSLPLSLVGQPPANTTFGF